MRILIIGASSYIGARLYLDLKRKFEVVQGTYNSNPLLTNLIPLDARDSASMMDVVKRARPDVIIDVVANPDAKWCADHQKEAQDINVNTAKNAADAANAVKAKLIYISSLAARNPVNVYAKTKLDAEAEAKNAKYGWLILRPGHVIGMSPNTVNERYFNNIIKDAKNNNESILDSSAKLNPTWVGHISEVIAFAINNNVYGAVVPIVSNALRSRYDLARDLFGKFGFKLLPRDEHRDTFGGLVDDSELRRLRMPTYSYPEIIAKVQSEVKRNYPSLVPAEQSRREDL